MSAEPGRSIPKSEPPQSEQPTTQVADVSKKPEARIRINWREVFGQSPGTVEQTTYAQAKEKAGAKEAEVSREAIELAKDNFGELVYLLLKNPNLILQSAQSQSDQLKGDQLIALIKQLSPELGKLLRQDKTSLPDAVTVIEKIQREINNIFTDDPQLSEVEKKIREIQRQQVLITGMAFLEFKMKVVAAAYQISANEKGPETPSDQEKQQIQEAKQKLERPPNVLVLDGKGNIIQEPLVSKDQYVDENQQKQPVSKLDKFLRRTEEAQRRKAAEEYENLKKILEQEREERPVRHTLEFTITENESTDLSKYQFLLTELGLMDKKGQLKEAEAVLPEIMAQIRATLSLRREILTATGVSGEQLFAALKDLSPSLSMIPSLDKLEPGSLKGRINEIIKQRRAENAERTREELNERKGQATISQLKIREKKLEEELGEIKKAEAKAEGAGEKPQLPEEGPTLEEIEGGVKGILEQFKDQLAEVKLIESSDKYESLVGKNLLAMIKILEARAKIYRRQREVVESQIKIMIEPLQAQLGRLRQRKAEAKTITSREKGVTTVEEPNLAGIQEEISKLEEQITNLWNGSELKDINEKLFGVEGQLAILQGIIESSVSIGGVEQTVEGWLRQYAIKKSQTSAQNSKTGQKEGGETGDGEKRTKEKVEDELAAVGVMIRYYSEDELSGREARILEMGDLQPDNVFTNEDLADIESRNQKLYELLPKDQDGNIAINDSRTILLVLRQVFGDKFIYPDDPNAPEIRGLIAILKGMGDLSSITSFEEFDKKMRELVGRFLKEGRLDLDQGKAETPSTATPSGAPVEATQKAKSPQPPATSATEPTSVAGVEQSTPPETQEQENQQPNGLESEEQPPESSQTGTPAEVPIAEQGDKKKRRKSGTAS